MPEFVYVILLQFQLYVSHDVTVDDDVELLLIVKSKVDVCTQPDAFKNVQV